MSKRFQTLTEELGEAEFAMREALVAADAAQRHLRIMTGWHAEILRLLEEEDNHG
jgi:hypothetical protein